MEHMVQGIIIKGIAGFYFVQTDAETLRCKARGIFKKEGIVPMVGDHVQVERNPMGDASVVRILPRKNSFIRPPVANVDTIAVVLAVSDPEPNIRILDRFLVMAEYHQTEILILLNKIDLDDGSRRFELTEIYEGLYPLLPVCGLTGKGILDLKKSLAGKTVGFAGPSGVGKSTIINRLDARIGAETGELSEKTGRGKHTTRHVELFDTDFGARIMDTPGFTSFQVLEAAPEELGDLFPEFQEFKGVCRFDNCRHLAEPGCAVRQAVLEGQIHPSRYESYQALYQEAMQNKKF